MSDLNKIIPVVSRRNLLLVAALVWLLAGLMLITRGLNMYFSIGGTYDLNTLISLIIGVIFYFAVFRKVSDKHIQRILILKNQYIPFYQFFNKRSYIMMLLMITMGVLARKTGIVPSYYLSLFYITMGTPLLISAFKFLHRRIKKNNGQTI